MAMSARRWLGWSSLLLSAALGLLIWAMLAVLATRPGFKKLFDLSPQARFTVSAATEELMAEVRRRELTLELHTVYEPLALPDDASEEARQVFGLRDTLQQLTTDLLRRYAYLGGDAVTVTHHDLRRDLEQIRELTRALDQRRSNFVLVKLGNRSKVLSVDLDLADLDFPDQSAPLPGGARRRVAVLKSYKGEEAISSAIQSLLVEGTPVVYFAAGHGEPDISRATASSYSELAQQLDNEGFAVRKLGGVVSAVPDDCTVLALMEPTKELQPTETEAIIAFLRRGGRVLLNVSYNLHPASWNPTFDDLGQRLGFRLGRDLVCHLIRDPANPRITLSQRPEVQNLACELNQAHAVTRPLAAAQRIPLLKAARELEPLAGDARPEGVVVEVLLRSGPLAWIEPRSAPGDSDPEPDYLAPGEREAFAPRPLALVVDVAPAADGGRAGALVVVSGVAFVNAAFRATANGDLGLNLMQWMAERRALVTVRGDRYRPNRLEVTPPQLERVQWLLVVWVPGGILVLGLLVLWRRSRI